MNYAVRVENLSKSYRIRHQGAGWAKYRTLREDLLRLARAPVDWFTRHADTTEEFWALRDVSFDVQPGEVLGIIGRNGAGKSTLLKILSQITEPTSGRIRLQGRVGSLLEVGTGFHPELSGRENIYLSGAVLGMTHSEVARKFDEIVAFAEVERFLDTPVKRYSSGMYMRLAFAVAAHLEPEILVIDEVLAVGDAAFQQKCLTRMRGAAREGRTVLMVSHNLLAVRKLCGRVVRINAGQMIRVGETNSVIDGYLEDAKAGMDFFREWVIESAPGNNAVRLLSVNVRNEASTTSTSISVPDGFRLEFKYRVLEGSPHLNLAFAVLEQNDFCVFASHSLQDPVWGGRAFPPGEYFSVCHVPGHLLNNGRYRLRVYVVQDRSAVIAQIDDVLSFDIDDSSVDRGDWFGRWDGIVRPRLNWETRIAG